MKIKFICLFLLSLVSHAEIISRGPTTIVNIYSDAYIEGELDRIVQSKIDTMTFTNIYNTVEETNYNYSTNIIQIVTNDTAHLLINWDSISNKPSGLSFDDTGHIKLSSISTTDDTGRSEFGLFINPYINYTNLQSKPIIPTKVSQLNNDANFLSADGIYRGEISDPHNLGSYCRVNPYPTTDAINENVTISDLTGARSGVRHFRNLQAAYDYSTRSGDNINVALLVKKVKLKISI